ncbi:MAG: hypothetical protein CTY33_00255 [Methylotenera sp.]|nr:MAG: hypothetical protein CTY33_00255 [Methylotenera sp.]
MKLNDIKIKPKTCRICRDKYVPYRALSPVCEKYECKVAYAIKSAEKAAIAREKKAKREHKEKLAKIKTRQEHLREAQRHFNLYVRIRDADLPCISCQRFHSGQYHAGHYRSVGSAPHLRFNELNCHRQCSVCNNHLSGNQLKYRQGLIAKLGIEAVEQLEADNAPKHYTIEEIQAIKVKYKQLTKQLKESQS